MIIGVTGGSGSGKTSLLKLLAQHGALVLDCDAIYHDLLRHDQAMLASLKMRFPEAFAAGVLDRKALGKLVFADPSALEDLNAITHGAVKQVVMNALKENHPLMVIDAIALFESGLAELCHVTVAVTAPVEKRVQRLMERDGVAEEYALSRIHAQKTDEAFSQMCQYTLCNNGSMEEFTDKCLAFFRELGII